MGASGGTAGRGGAGGEAGASGSHSDTSRDAGDASDGLDADSRSCEQRSSNFTNFVSSNLTCSEDSDCTMIGDCEPHVDWTAINVAAADQGYSLMLDRCSGPGADGPTYAAICVDGQCAKGEQNGCCGCPPDAGSTDN